MWQIYFLLLLIIQNSSQDFSNFFPINNGGEKNIFDRFTGIFESIMEPMTDFMKSMYISQPIDVSKIEHYDLPEMNLSTPEIIQYHGYPVENHTVITPDGYILEIFRIPRGRKRSQGPRTPIMIQHGLMSSSADWVLNLPEQSLGFIAADEGYDVWLTNARGNIYCRNHTKLNVNSNEFWSFSWDQMAQYDVPTIIDHILKTTGYSQIYYVGHSMGTTMAFAMLSSNPEYNSKIKTMAALAPVAYAHHMKSPLNFLSPFVFAINFMQSIFGLRGIDKNSEVWKQIGKGCLSNYPALCENLLALTFDINVKNINITRLDMYLNHSPAGSSVMSVVHYIQLANARKFQYYDWGIENYQKYRKLTPKEYDLSFVTTQVASFWAEKDILAVPKDVALLEAKLRNLIVSHKVDFESFTHADFLLGLNAKELVYDLVFEKMPRFNK